MVFDSFFYNLSKFVYIPESIILIYCKTSASIRSERSLRWDNESNVLKIFLTLTIFCGSVKVEQNGTIPTTLPPTKKHEEQKKGFVGKKKPLKSKYCLSKSLLEYLHFF
jgi:hypothetical protein